MAAIVIDGKQLSAEKMENLAKRVETLKGKGITPGLAVVLVGEDPASQIYVRSKEKACQTLGLHSIAIRLEEKVEEEELLKKVEELNQDPSIHGILVQLPLPKHIHEQRVIGAIKAEKDVDGFHIENVGKMFLQQEGIVACTPKGVLEMIRFTGVDIVGKDAVVVGKSNIVGKPMAVLLMNEEATVSVCHIFTKDLASYTKKADILVVAAGSPKLITADMVKPGAVVIDVGINRVDGKVVGDVDFEEVKKVAGFISPVPGGVGKMTIAMLMDNIVTIAEKGMKV
ncbi:MAG: bifunctional methylenetetrahydrofolate dehydrogenase/methenyltetrahydrofolate cyclohydrolase FolD [Clostridiales bacterium]|nr:bifunctional methylenetetrahydrofolate dehydrogenase/methenyltetrahydrofolate cyclohydrolase FolD [Clostridiales bacterium]